ncbi:hypothetical protein HYV85_01085 [Candidatus Woesearchaeota archaeon]|nr:hypothetical protein [Candidatus Woesearchaeota archaeon]
MGSFGKKGQTPASGPPSGANAAILIFVIAGFILMYILFLPKGEQRKLLEKETTTVTATPPGALPGSILLSEKPGTLTRLKEREFDHSIPSFNLFTKKEDTVLKAVDSVYVEESRGVSKKKTMILTIRDKIENAKLSFTVNDHKGNLMIRLNDNELFTGEVDSFTEPLSLELEEENLFEFSTEPVPWWKPFTKNFYDLRDVGVTATVEKLENKEALQTFIVGEEEANLLSEASLSYFVDCNVKDVGKLAIYLNSNLLASKVPDCGSAEKWQIDPNDLNAGKNELRFVAEKGTYLLDRLLLRTKLKEPIFPVYFFTANSTVFRRIENNTINSSLSIRFVDDKERKTATLEINSQKTRLDTRAANYSKNIDSFLVEGSNFIRVVPETTLNIIELKVLLDCKKAEECS